MTPVVAEPLLDRLYHTSPEDRIQRNQAEADKIRNSNSSRCLLTGSHHFEACPVVPFSFNASGVNRLHAAALAHLINAFVPKARVQDLEDLLGRTKGASDKSWNMICLHPLLQTAWLKMEFALSWFDSEPDECPGMTVVRLKVHPLKTLPANDKTYKRLSRKVATSMMSVFEGRLLVPTDMSACSIESVNAVDSASMVDFLSHYPIVNGQLASTSIRNVDVDKFKVMIEVQYCVIVMCKMAGGADPLDWLYDYDDGSPYAALAALDRRGKIDSMDIE